jgi:two-component system chemotaxis sensor kinase CheA
MAIDNQALLRTFAAESEEQLVDMERGLDALGRERQGEKAGETARLLYRLVHTLEGSAATVGLDELTRLAHATKKAVDALRQQRVTVTDELLAGLAEATTALRAALARLGDETSPPDHRPLLDRLARIAAGEQITAHNSAPTKK